GDRPVAGGDDGDGLVDHDRLTGAHVDLQVVGVPIASQVDPSLSPGGRPADRGPGRDGDADTALGVSASTISTPGWASRPDTAVRWRLASAAYSATFVLRTPASTPERTVTVPDQPSATRVVSSAA